MYKFGKMIQWHSNHSLQLFESKKATKKQNKSSYLNIFFCDILICNTQYFHTTEHTYTRLTFVISPVGNEFSSK